MTKREQSAEMKGVFEENVTCDRVEAGQEARTCGSPGGYGCYQDVHCSFEGVLTRVGVLAESADRQHEDADLQDESKDTELVEVLQAGIVSQLLSVFVCVPACMCTHFCVCVPVCM